MEGNSRRLISYLLRVVTPPTSGRYGTKVPWRLFALWHSGPKRRLFFASTSNTLPTVVWNASDWKRARTPYDAGHNHVLYSLSKSFTSTAVGLAIAEGNLSVDDEVLKFFPEDGPTNVGSNLKAMRVRDLMMMSTGHQDEPPTSPDAISAKSFLAQPVPHLPGTHFKYNTPATFMQSASALPTISDS